MRRPPALQASLVLFDPLLVGHRLREGGPRPQLRSARPLVVVLLRPVLVGVLTQLWEGRGGVSIALTSPGRRPDPAVGGEGRGQYCSDQSW